MTVANGMNIPMSKPRIKKTPWEKETDQERYTRLLNLYNYKVGVHTNPVEIGWKDLEWMLSVVKRELDRKTVKQLSLIE